VCCAVLWLCVLQDPTASLETLLKALPDGSAPKATYVKGDKVEVIAGDLTSLTGGCDCSDGLRPNASVCRQERRRHTVPNSDWYEVCLLGCRNSLPICCSAVGTDCFARLLL
jgi:hypothetical protein